MEKNAKIFVAGHRGLVGSAITRRLKKAGYENLLLRTRLEVDLTDFRQVLHLFEIERPEYVFLAAAKVGGIQANNIYRADFILENLKIQNNVIESAWKTGVKKLMFLGSSCIYPKMAPQPLKEEYLLTGVLEPTNEPYAIAKIAGIKTCESFNRQYGTNYISVMPTNLYGPNDNFDLNNSHVLPALIRKFVTAKEAGADSVVIWGTGSPRREFLYADDMADACVFLMENYSGDQFVNIGTGEDVTIKELAETIKAITGFNGDLVFDSSKPDGTPRKLLDVSKLRSMGWSHQTSLESGVRLAVDWYLENKSQFE
ncbi:MAG: GDP-L-fucose synthase [Bacteroidetes bacterium]|nr:GDP-L-fucose synthase [Bacteroidota bacterium]